MSRGPRREQILEVAATMFASSGLKTPLRDIATACDMLPGSLYFHFDSKEAIVLELVQRYMDDLDCVAQDGRERLRESDSGPLLERVIEFGKAIASCADRHRAVLLVTLYGLPSGASDELRQLVRRAPAAIHETMSEILQPENGADRIRPGIDLALLADRLCESMVRNGITSAHLGHDRTRLPELRCRVLLEGLATRPPSNAALDRSDALRSAQEIVATWNVDADADDRVTRLKAVARAEFGRRSYEVTTLREIAAAAGLSTGTVYRLFPAKEMLLESIMGTYADRRKAAWGAVLNSDSSPLEKVDALTWLYIELLEYFGDELRIQLSLARASPASVERVVPPNCWRDLESLLTAGTRAGEIRLVDGSARLYARCLYEALWTPEAIVRAAGVAGAHALARDSVLAGALSRSEDPSG
jgi:AcrR family transcriptional regulator